MPHTTDGETGPRHTHPITPAQLDAIRRYDVCAVADAIEYLRARLSNEGFARPGLRCFTQKEPRLLGYASTFKVKTSDPPTMGGAFLEQTDWWPPADQQRFPRIAVMQDVEPKPVGACLGEVHSSLFKALQFDGVITNGAVRDVPAVRQLRFPVFAQFIGLSRAYTHIIEYGKPVEILGLWVHEGDLLYADMHGVISIPPAVVDDIALVAREIRAKEARLIQACLSPHLSREELKRMISQGEHHERQK